MPERTSANELLTARGRALGELRSDVAGNRRGFETSRTRFRGKVRSVEVLFGRALFDVLDHSLEDLEETAYDSLRSLELVVELLENELEETKFRLGRTGDELKRCQAEKEGLRMALERALGWIASSAKSTDLMPTWLEESRALIAEEPF